MANPPDGAVVPSPCVLAAPWRADAVAVQVDLHRLELRFAATRIVDGAAVQRLANSIHEYGQLVLAALRYRANMAFRTRF